MANNNQTQIVKDLPNRKIIITREFEVSSDNVWKAWTDSELLDQWWAPKPWKAETNIFDFREGGFWLYAMVEPDNSKHWARVDFDRIDVHKSFQATYFFVMKTA